jgi:hypothetical protein
MLLLVNFNLNYYVKLIIINNLFILKQKFKLIMNMTPILITVLKF